MTIAAPQALPRWDLDVIFPGVDSPRFVAELDQIASQIDDLLLLFDKLAETTSTSESPGKNTVIGFDRFVERFNALLDTVDTVGAYLYGLVTTDSRDVTAQARLSEFQQRTLPLDMLLPRFVARIGSVDADSLLAQSAVARDHEFVIRHAAESARHLMSPAEEALAAELHLTGGNAWTRLHGNLTSQISVPLELDGAVQQLPMSDVRNLAYHRDRDIRRRAYEAELAAWRANAVPIAAALNGVKGETSVLARRRGWSQPLDLAAFQNHVDRSILDAMFEAAHDAFPDFRRYLRAKAKAVGVDALAWYDLFAPISQVSRPWSFDRAADFIVTHFGRFSTRLRDLATRSLAERWIDAEPRAGKVSGAYCLSVGGDSSRILMNYTSSYNAMSTLAHELGHAYHNLALAGRSFLQRTTPAILSETASTFCETLVLEPALAEAGDDEAISILDNALQETTQTVVDITSRWLFEQRLFAARTARELSVDELNRLMLDAQLETYGDALDPDSLHPFMWAVKGHYYGVAEPFYNFPYLYGLLFGLGLYARYLESPDSFGPLYDDLLASTGMDDPVALAARFEVDIRSAEFWRSSLDVLRKQIDRFVDLTENQTAHSTDERP